MSVTSQQGRQAQASIRRLRRPTEGQEVESRVRTRRPALRAAAVLMCLAATLGALFVNTPAASAATTETVFGTSTPSAQTTPDDDALTIGLKFTTTSPGSITAIRFFKGAGNTGPHVGAIYSSTGVQLAKATVTNESATGWQTATLSTPVEAKDGATYTAAMYLPAGHFSFSRWYDWPVERPNLTGQSGTFSYGAGLRYPNQTYAESNYFVDVAFVPGTVVVPPVDDPPTEPPAEPSNGDFPDASNTGVPAGTTLSTYTGPATITTPGTVIDSKKVTSCLVIRADNVTIKNSLIQSGGCFFNVLADNDNTGLKLTDVEIDGQGNTRGDSAINGGGLTCLRCDIHGTIDGIKPQDDVVIQDSYIHDLTMTADSHNDGIQSLGTTSLRILHNSIVIEDGSTSAIILSTGSAWAMRNIQIDGNLLGGGAYTVYGGYRAGVDSLSKVSNISITNNRFTTRIHPKSGAYGPLTSTDSPVVVSGNTWYDGPNAGRPVY